MEAYQKSSEAVSVDSTAPWADPAIDCFFKLLGGGQKRGNAGVFYAFLLSLHYPILQELVEVCMGESLRVSGSMALKGDVVGLNLDQCTGALLLLMVLRRPLTMSAHFIGNSLGGGVSISYYT